MANPTAGDVYVNQPLTQLSIAFLQDMSEFVADRAAPNIPVDLQGGQYWTFDRGDWNRVVSRPRAPASESAGAGFDIDPNNTYFANVHAVHKDVDDQTRANMGSTAPTNFALDRAATEWVTRQNRLEKEQLWAQKFFAAGIWTTQVQGVSGAPGAGEFKQWDQTGSDPIGDIETRVLAMKQTSGGFKPNKLALGALVYSKLKNHASTLDRIKYGSSAGNPALVTPLLIAAMVGVEEVLVLDAVLNSGAKGAAESNAFLAGKHALLFYAPKSASPMTPSAMYTFSWTGYLGAGPAGNRVKSFRMEPIASDRVEGEMAYDMKLISQDLGAFFKDAIG